MFWHPERGGAPYSPRLARLGYPRLGTPPLPPSRPSRAHRTSRSPVGRLLRDRDQHPHPFGTILQQCRPGRRAPGPGRSYGSSALARADREGAGHRRENIPTVRRGATGEGVPQERYPVGDCRSTGHVGRTERVIHPPTPPLPDHPVLGELFHNGLSRRISQGLRAGAGGLHRPLLFHLVGADLPFSRTFRSWLLPPLGGKPQLCPGINSLSQ